MFIGQADLHLSEIIILLERLHRIKLSRIPPVHLLKGTCQYGSRRSCRAAFLRHGWTNRGNARFNRVWLSNRTSTASPITRDNSRLVSSREGVCFWSDGSLDRFHFCRGRCAI